MQFTNITTVNNQKELIMKKISTITFAIAVTAGIFSAPLALASDAHHAPVKVQVAQATAAMSEGEVKKVNKETGKMTVKHGELKNLGMPPMTMVFRVKEPAMLDQVKAGDKIRFVADKVNGQLTMSQLQAAK